MIPFIFRGNGSLPTNIINEIDRKGAAGTTADNLAQKAGYALPGCWNKRWQ